MADTKLSALTELGAAADDADLLYLLSDPGGTPLDRSVTRAHLLSGYALLTDIATGTITARTDDVDLSGGSDGDVLTVQADGSLALETPAAGVSPSGTPADNQIAVFTDADTIEGSSALVFGAPNEGIKVTSGAATTVPCKVVIASGQTANALEINSSGGSGGNLCKITSSGLVETAGGFTFNNGTGKFTVFGSGSTARIQVGNTSSFYVDVYAAPAKSIRTGVPIKAAENSTITWTSENRLTGRSLELQTGFEFGELSADPSDPSEGRCVVWQSDGTGAGDDGDIMLKVTAGGVTKTVTLVDHSAF